MGMSHEFARNIEAAKAAGNDRAMRSWQAHRELFDIDQEAGLIQELPLEARPVTIQQSQEGTVAPEQLALRERFTEAEKEALSNDGAVIYLLSGETIQSQQKAQKVKGKPSFDYLVNAGERLLAKKPREIEVAIYPDPAKFFVPDSFNENVNKQDELVAQDAKNLRERLNLTTISEIIPEEAAVLSDVTFQHLDETGVLLFSKEYAQAQGLDWVYGRTKNPTNASGSHVARVGSADPAYGLGVGDWRRGRGNRNVGAVRLVVPIENR